MTRKFVALALVAALMAAFVAIPAEAAKKKKKKAKPVATTLFLDGDSAFGEQDAGVPVAAPGTFHKLVAEAGSSEKSRQVLNYGVGPNTQCAGNSLMPVFVGPFAGTVTGDITVKFEAMSTPGASVEVRIWPDVAAQACNDAYIEPARSAVVALPAGQGMVEAVLSGADFTAAAQLMLQVTPVLVPPFIGRMFYGTDASTVELTCIPASGTSCIPS